MDMSRVPVQSKHESVLSLVPSCPLELLTESAMQVTAVQERSLDSYYVHSALKFPDVVLHNALRTH